MKLQMANRWGIRNLAHVAAKAVSEHGILDGGEQYWSPGDLLKEASALMDRPTLKAWGFFCLDSEPCDLPYIGWKNRAVLGISQFLRNRALKSGWMHWFADSLSLEALRDSRGTRP